MESPDILSRMPSKRPAWIAIACVLWGGVLLALLLRAGLHPHRLSSLTTYLAGGARWSASQPLYTNWRGFIYPPVIAWVFSLLDHMPLAAAAVLWRFLTAGTFLFGLWALLRSGVFHRIPAGYRGIVFLAVLPLSIGNLDNAQANPLIAGLMMMAVAALQWQAWSLCALAIALATTFKIYPLALGLLFCVLRPRELSWRIALMLLGLGLLPFALQDSHYIAGQYHAWFQSRLADDRFHYPMKDAPLDLWYLLVRLGNLPISERAYTAAQVIAGCGLAAFVYHQVRRGAALRDILADLFLLVSVWMLLLGPATENQTYVVLAPAACLFGVRTLNGSYPVFIRVLALSAFTLLLAAVARNSLLPALKSPLYMAVQPVGALVLLAAVLGDLQQRPVTAPASPQ